ncbi:MAG: hypothetical protein ACREVG_04765, partial [Burkholderiales bacterium]
MPPRQGGLQTQDRQFDPLAAPAAAAADVVALYRGHLARRGFVSDSAQWRAVERLQRLYEEWTAYKARRNT